MIHKVINELAQSKEKTDEQYYSLQTAIDQAKPGDIIEISPGIYKEKITLTTDNLILRGTDSKSCIITFDDYAWKIGDDGEKLGTFRSYSCLILADHVVFENLTIQNSAGDGRDVGQAIALFARGDRLRFINCEFIGYQDTLFAGPLPPSPRIPGSFVGPTETLSYKKCRHYYENCTITGDIDFIFGSALAVFNYCKIVSRNRHEEINGYVTAPSTWEEEAYGFVFLNCIFTGEEGIAKQSVFLSRPWRAFGQVAIASCYLDDCIHEEKWDPWGNIKNFETTTFKEYDSMFDIRYILDSWHKEMLNFRYESDNS